MLSHPKFPAIIARRPRRRAGYSLVEVMIAAAIITIGGAGVLAVMTRLQRNAITNRAYTNSYNILRNVMDQAMQRGWEDENFSVVDESPEMLLPTITGTNATYATNPAHNASVEGNAQWKRWDMYSAKDAASGYDAKIKVYQDAAGSTNVIDGRLYRKVQHVQNLKRMLWITFRLEYTAGGKFYAQNLCCLRAVD